MKPTLLLALLLAGCGHMRPAPPPSAPGPNTQAIFDRANFDCQRMGYAERSSPWLACVEAEGNRAINEYFANRNQPRTTTCSPDRLGGFSCNPY